VTPVWNAFRIEFGGLSGACRRRQRVVDDDD
jgi:hypothetical protein